MITGGVHAFLADVDELARPPPRGGAPGPAGTLRGVPPAGGLRFDPRQKLWVFPWLVLRGG